MTCSKAPMANPFSSRAVWGAPPRRRSAACRMRGRLAKPLEPGGGALDLLSSPPCPDRFLRGPCHSDGADLSLDLRHCLPAADWIDHLHCDGGGARSARSEEHTSD